MDSYKSLQPKIINLDDKDFAEVALAIFRYQAQFNEIYRTYLGHLQVDAGTILHWSDIPFMPIELFKAHKVVTTQWQEDAVFHSSGTGGSSSQHYIRDLQFYHQISQQIFESVYGPLGNYHLLALLPGYLENPNSSLINMIQHFIEVSQSPYSGFYLDQYQQLLEAIQAAQRQGDRKVLLWGVSFALWDFAEAYPGAVSDLMIMETGGMKGRRQEITRKELHQVLKAAFDINEVHSEYGMAELVSQAYADAEGWFHTPPWMKIIIRDIDDPLSRAQPEATGVINVIDLGNLHSCAFLATEDLGLCHRQGFQVLGRMDNSEMRGCNLMIS